MSPTLAIILFVIGVVLFLAGLYLSYQSSQAQKTFEEAKRKLDEERSELEKRANKAAQGGKKTSASDKTSDHKQATETTGLNAAQEEELRKQVSASRDKLAKQREKNQHVARERDELKKRVSDLESSAKQPAHDANALVDLRMELGEAKQEAARFKQRIEELEKSGKSSKKHRDTQDDEPVARAAEPVDVAPAEPLPEAASSSSEDQAAYIDQLKGRLRDGERQMREQEDELRKRLKKQGRDIERQMRRADNNDKAYRITQRELDAARERIVMLTEQLERARFAAASTSQAQDHPGLVDISPLQVHDDVPEEEMTMESPEITQDVIEQDAALAEAAEIIEELASEASTVTSTEPTLVDISDEEPEAHVAEEPIEAALPDLPEEPAALPVEQETGDVSSEDDASVEAPTVEHASGEETVEVAVAPAASETEVERVAQVPEGDGLAEISAVDEAWGEIDLDDEDEDL